MFFGKNMIFGESMVLGVDTMVGMVVVAVVGYCTVLHMVGVGKSFVRVDI